MRVRAVAWRSGAGAGRADLEQAGVRDGGRPRFMPLAMDGRHARARARAAQARARAGRRRWRPSGARGGLLGACGVRRAGGKRLRQDGSSTNVHLRSTRRVFRSHSPGQSLLSHPNREDGDEGICVIIRGSLKFVKWGHLYRRGNFDRLVISQRTRANSP